MPKIVIKSRPERFRRAGFEFTRAGVELELEKLTKEQREALEAEPNLVIAAATADEKAPAKTKGAK